MSRIAAIYNPASGNAPTEEELRGRLVDGIDLLETTPDDAGQGQAAEAVRNGAEVVVACGGDGTVRACLDSVIESDATLAIVPLGTGNLLARNLGLPDGLDASVTVDQGLERKLDIGRINGEPFAVMAGTGFDALMIRDTPPGLKSRIGTLAYVIAALRNLRASLVPTRVEVDGRPWYSGTTSMVLVGNFGEITGGIEVFPAAAPDDGLLDVAVLHTESLRDWLSVLWRLVRGRPQDLRLARRTQGRSIRVHQSRPRPYELDGELRDPARVLDLEVVPGHLRVLGAAEPEPGEESGS